MCPSSGSFHTTSAPSLFFCLIRNLSLALPPSSHLTGCSTDGSHGNSDSYSAFTRMERASVEGLYVSLSLIIISGDNRLDQDEATLTSMEFFIRESCICVNNEHSCTSHVVYGFPQSFWLDSAQTCHSNTHQHMCLILMTKL